MLKPSCDVGTSVSGMLIKNKVEKTFDNTCVVEYFDTSPMRKVLRHILETLIQLSVSPCGLKRQKTDPLLLEKLNIKLHYFL